MVCEQVARMTQMPHDNLANALCLVVSACSCQSAVEPCYRSMASNKGMVEAGVMVAVLSPCVLAAVDVEVAHAFATTYAAQAARRAGWTAARAERTKRTPFSKDVPDHAAFLFVPHAYAVETCGCRAVRSVNHLGDITVESGRNRKGVCAGGNAVSAGDGAEVEC